MAAPLPLALQFDVDVEAVIEAARAAGAVILGIYAQDSQWEVEQKSDSSPLTRADREANALICGASRRVPYRGTGLSSRAGRLALIAPHVPIVSEENTAVPFDVRRKYQYSWCVDPLDGTKAREARRAAGPPLSPGRLQEFIKRNGQFTVNIALLRGGTPIMGVVHTPVTASPLRAGCRAPLAHASACRTARTGRWRVAARTCARATPRT